MPEKKPTEWATIGKIVAPFGVYGELKVLSLSDIPDRFAQLEAVYLAPQYRRYTIERVRPYRGDMVLLTLEGVDDMTLADALRNHELCIPLDQLAALPSDSYYQHDILGLRVLTMEQKEVGNIVEIIPTGGNDVYVIRKPDGQQVMIPAVKEIVKQIDLPRGVMLIDPIRGLIDDDAIVDDPNVPVAQEEEEEIDTSQM